MKYRVEDLFAEINGHIAKQFERIIKQETNYNGKKRILKDNQILVRENESLRFQNKQLRQILKKQHFEEIVTKESLADFISGMYSE